MTLTQLRQSKDFSLRELAKVAGLLPSVLSGLEQGTVKPSADYITKIRIALGVPFDDVSIAMFHSKALMGRPSKGSVTISCGPAGCKIERTP